MKIKTTLREQIKSARKKAGLSQVKLASLLGVTDQAVYLWETGRTSPEYDMVEKIADALGKDPLWFYRAPEEAGPPPEGKRLVSEEEFQELQFLRQLERRYFPRVAGILKDEKTIRKFFASAQNPLVAGGLQIAAGWQ